MNIKIFISFAVENIIKYEMIYIYIYNMVLHINHRLSDSILLGRWSF